VVMRSRLARCGGTLTDVACRLKTSLSAPGPCHPSMVLASAADLALSGVPQPSCGTTDIMKEITEPAASACGADHALYRTRAGRPSLHCAMT